MDYTSGEPKGKRVSLGANYNSGFYFSIPDDKMTDFHTLDEASLEVQIVSSEWNNFFKSQIDYFQNIITDNNSTVQQKRQAQALLNRLNKKYHVIGSIYGVKGPSNLLELGKDWNTVNVKLTESKTIEGWNATVSVNGTTVNNHDIADRDKKRWLGNIGFQAHDENTDVYYKGVRWKKLD